MARKQARRYPPVSSLPVAHQRRYELQSIAPHILQLQPAACEPYTAGSEDEGLSLAVDN